MGWNENKHASLKRELIYASAAGESLAKQLNLEYFALSKDPKVFFPLELNLHLEVVFFFFSLITCSMCFTKCLYQAVMALCSLCLEPGRIL